MDAGVKTAVTRQAMGDLVELVARAVVSGVGVAVVMAVAILVLAGGSRNEPANDAARAAAVVADRFN